VLLTLQIALFALLAFLCMASDLRVYSGKPLL